MIEVLAGCAGTPLLTLDDPRSSWVREGWIRMEAPTHLPSGEQGRESVEVWLFVPAGEALHTEALPDGRTGLVFPRGSAADRVEWRGDGESRRIVDVRGTTLGRDGGRTHHVYQPIARNPAAALLGVEWPAGDASASAVALDRFAAAVRPHRPQPDDWERSYRSKHGCDGCHVVDRPTNQVPGEHGLVNRGTDGQGWFTPSTVLASAVPGESYGMWHADRGDPFALPSCPEARTSRNCDDGSVPTWTLDVPAGLAARDAHALEHCASVTWVRDHLDPADPALAEDGALSNHPCLSKAVP